jgi:hypothetical protein
VPDPAAEKKSVGFTFPSTAYGNHIEIGIFFLWAEYGKNGVVLSITMLIQDVVWFYYPAFIGKGALVQKSETHRLST